MITNQRAANRMTAARMQLTQRAPFFGCLALILPYHETDAVPVMASDGERYLYNPQWAETAPFEEILFVLMHECWHCAAGHIPRMKGKPNKLANIAMDAQTNWHVSQLHVGRMPAQGIWDSEVENETLEQTYARYQQMAQDEPEDGSKGKKQKGQGQGQGAGMPQGDAWDFGHIQEPEGGLTAEQAQQMAHEWEQRLIQAAVATRSKGNLPGFVRDYLDRLTNPEQDWRAVLAEMARGFEPVDLRAWPPSRRYLWQGLALPSIKREGVQSIVLLIDTSGSCISHLPLFWGEASGIIESVRPQKLYIVQIDTKVARVDTYEFGETLPDRIEVAGYGGTDFRPGFDWVDENEPNPDAVIYFTDLWGEFPKQEPPYRVIWAATTDEPVPFGEVLRIK